MLQMDSDEQVSDESEGACKTIKPEIWKFILKDMKIWCFNGATKVGSYYDTVYTR